MLTRATGTKASLNKAAAAKTAAKAAASSAAKPGAKPAAPRAATDGASLQPCAALAAVIGLVAVARTHVIKKLDDSIKANKLQDPANKRDINADAKRQVVIGKPLETMLGRAPSWNGHPFT